MTKNLLIVLLGCLVLGLATGFEPIKRTVNEALYRGSLKGVENCIGYTRSELVSEQATRDGCTTRFQKPLYDSNLAMGTAGPRTDDASVKWVGTLENRTPDRVTTWIEIAVKIFDSEGNEDEYTGQTQIWIDPQNEAEFLVEMPDLNPKALDELEFCDDETTSPKACMAWGIVGLMGLTI